MFNGILITRFNVAPFIATLGTLYVARGAAQLSNDGATFPNLVGRPELGEYRIPHSWSGQDTGYSDRDLDHGDLCIGRRVHCRARPRSGAKSTPWEETSARPSSPGIYVNRIKMGVYMICGLCAAMTGLITASQLVAAHPAIGESYELNAIAAVVLGGTSLVRRSRYDVGNDRRRSSYWRAYERPRAARCPGVLEKGNHRILLSS